MACQPRGGSISIQQGKLSNDLYGTKTTGSSPNYSGNPNHRSQIGKTATIGKAAAADVS